MPGPHRTCEADRRTHPLGDGLRAAEAMLAASPGAALVHHGHGGAQYARLPITCMHAKALQIELSSMHRSLLDFRLALTAHSSLGRLLSHGLA